MIQQSLKIFTAIYNPVLTYLNGSCQPHVTLLRDPVEEAAAAMDSRRCGELE